ncbi:MAG: Acetyl-CoA carboxylase [Thermodesulfobacterium sp. 37_54]|nr:MAG: Acetyl-CoA carboxylase [Thermodesulfobacterium sp. 37_54]KUK19125.1 MAG: Acetyl-CoA carboxylase [Thermodesulfobacterium commune]HBT04768.1 acetyl-CoA carboxylase carboxyl transferase subunit alpha/beta [Thermodesulfobacterium commune]HCP09408.1 acetyl-CoA carboxylase carboxyl transferase subunit alpha/beta [Thermodesulfobacterium commune]
MKIELYKTLKNLLETATYIRDIKGEDFFEITSLINKISEVYDNFYQYEPSYLEDFVKKTKEQLDILLEQGEKTLTPYEIVKITRHHQRFTLQDILENVYDSYMELGGEGEINIDPAVVCAKAMLVRKVEDEIFFHQVMVIGHEKGHGEEFREGGSAKPWGNEKALRYMKMAETEGIPIHFFIFTPGAYPIEDYPGAAQQIAKNLYYMAKLRVPTIAFISEGGSGGAEAIGLADMRLMAEKGYYSVISPEGAAAIEAKIKDGRPPRELVEKCARSLKLTAKDNLRFGTIDKIIPEPPLGARRKDYEFFKRLKIELIRATDEVILQTRSIKFLRKYAVSKQETENFKYYVNWDLDEDEIEILIENRYKKYRKMTQWAVHENKTLFKSFFDLGHTISIKLKNEINYKILKQGQKTFKKFLNELTSESTLLLKPVSDPIKTVYNLIGGKKTGPKLITPSLQDDDIPTYISPLALEDKTITCPQAEKYGCPDLWVPDLYGEFCGVCPNCGYHFPLEYKWYLNNIFDKNSIRTFNDEIASTNPLEFEGYAEKLKAAREKTGLNSSLISFEAKIGGISLIAVMLIAEFRQGTVGVAEGEKFIRAIELAKLTRRPFLALVHTTGGIRIHEGTLGVVQMPRCTMAVRDYVDEGGLYIVVYDNNSYAGPVASFLGSAPYQFALKSTRLGFAGPRVIKETTGQDVPPDYHSAENALKRGHIQGIWDRRELRKKLFTALLTMGGKNLYYRW